MQRSIYIRPMGIFADTRGDVSGEDLAGQIWGGLPLAGGPLSFSALEIIERCGRGIVRRTIGLGDLFERDWGRNTLAASDLLEAIRAPRARLAGMSLGRVRIMGIVNVTPDSFSDGGSFTQAQTAVEHGLRLADEGADILDIGGGRRGLARTPYRSTRSFAVSFRSSKACAPRRTSSSRSTRARPK